MASNFLVNIGLGNRSLPVNTLKPRQNDLPHFVFNILKVSIQAVIGLKQPRDQDSPNTTINKNYTLIMWIKSYWTAWIVPKLSWNHSWPQNYHV